MEVDGVKLTSFSLFFSLHALLYEIRSLARPHVGTGTASTPPQDTHHNTHSARLLAPQELWGGGVGEERVRD